MIKNQRNNNPSTAAPVRKAESSAQTGKAPPVRKAEPVRESTPVRKAAPGRESTPVRKAAPVKKAANPTPVDQRMKKLEEYRAARSAKKPAAGSGLNSALKKFRSGSRSFAANIIKGKPMHSKSERDFPINSGPIGKLKRYGPAKVYRLKGYTTIGRVNKKRRMDRFFDKRKHLIIFIFVIVLLLIFMISFRPFNVIKQLLFNIGY